MVYVPSFCKNTLNLRLKFGIITFSFSFSAQVNKLLPNTNTYLYFADPLQQLLHLSHQKNSPSDVSIESAQTVKNNVWGICAVTTVPLPVNNENMSYSKLK